MSLATITILSDGEAIDRSWELLSLDVRREVNRIPTASLTFSDETSRHGPGPVKKTPFGISGAATFRPSAQVQIKLRHEDHPNSEATVFKGLVIRNRVQADADGCRFHVELKDAAVKMTLVRKWRVFTQATDSDVIQKLIQEAALTAAIQAQTTLAHPELVQYDCTDWDFASARAEANGLILLANDGQIVLQKIKISETPHYGFDFDLGQIRNLEMELNAATQLLSVQSFGWDVTNQAASAPASAASFSLRQGNLTGAAIAGSLGTEETTLCHPVPLTEDELQAWADGRLARSRLALLRGRFSTTGRAKMKLLDVIKLQNVGDRFNGTTIVTGLRHSVGPDGWLTDVQFGLSPERISEQPGFSGTPAAGLLPVSGGLQVGIVSKIADDPDGQYRVQVKLAAMSEEGAVIWARWASPDAANARGWFFLPDVGDEVVVGFFNQDPRYPVVLGRLFSSKNVPPDPFKNVDEKNTNKGLVTKAGTKIVFVDAEKPNVSVETPGGNKVLLDDDKGSITLTDKNGNSITMDANGIKVVSKKDLGLEASGNITIKGAKVDVQ